MDIFVAVRTRKGETPDGEPDIRIDALGAFRHKEGANAQIAESRKSDPVCEFSGDEPGRGTYMKIKCKIK